jgi:flagellar hook assembly protein FlgD
MKLRAWDILNNVSEKTIDFVVASDEELTLEHVLNYPNPFTTRTAFYFEHNTPAIPMDVMIQIFTVSGKIVKTLESSQITTGNRSEPIYWDGRDDYGDVIGKGTYIYRLKVRTSDGKSAEKIEKLVIL